MFSRMRGLRRLRQRQPHCPRPARHLQCRNTTQRCRLRLLQSHPRGPGQKHCYHRDMASHGDSRYGNTPARASMFGRHPQTSSVTAHPPNRGQSWKACRRPAGSSSSRDPLTKSTRQSSRFRETARKWPRAQFAVGNSKKIAASNTSPEKPHPGAFAVSFTAFEDVPCEAHRCGATLSCSNSTRASSM